MRRVRREIPEVNPLLPIRTKLSSFKSTVTGSTIFVVGSNLPMRTFWSLFVASTAGRVVSPSVSERQCAGKHLRGWTPIHAATEQPLYDLMDPQPGNLLLKFCVYIMTIVTLNHFIAISSYLILKRSCYATMSKTDGIVLLGARTLVKKSNHLVCQYKNICSLFFYLVFHAFLHCPPIILILRIIYKCI